MKKIYVAVMLSLCFAAPAWAQTMNWSSVEHIIGRKGTVQGDMYKITFPRSDLNVKVGAIQVKPDLALTSWLAFKPHGNEYMVMGDLVLLPSEVKAVEEKLIANGFDVSAMHNHLIGSNPSVMYMHVEGYGQPDKLATVIKDVLKQTRTPMGTPGQAKPVAHDWSQVQTILNSSGKDKGQVIQFSFPRTEAITDSGMEMPPFMGTATAINLQAVGQKAVTTGDFVLLADEVQPVVKALVSHGLTVTAIHNHMLHEEPRILFLHFWGYDTAEKLAQGLRAALDETNFKQGAMDVQLHFERK